MGPALTCRRVRLVDVDHVRIDVTGASQRQHILVRVVAVLALSVILLRPGAGPRDATSRF